MFKDLNHGWRIIQVWKLPGYEQQDFDPHALALLQVSKEVHAETVLLPYQFGTFFFSKMRAQDFLKYRTRQQITAVRKVRLIVFYSGTQNWAEVRAAHEPNLDICSRFAGVQDLELIHSASQAINKEKLVPILMELRDLVQECLPGLKRLALSTALEGSEGDELRDGIQEALMGSLDN